MDWTNAIARILKSNHQSAGTGFVVSSDGLIVTCAHVVNIAIGRSETKDDRKPEPASVISLTFKADTQGTQYIARIEAWSPPSAYDIAILRLQSPLPQNVNTVRLGCSQRLQQHAPLLTFGYPDGYGQGLAGDIRVVMRVPHGTGQVLQIHSGEATNGFSGSPAWDASTSTVVGLVNEITAPDKYKRLMESGFVILAEDVVRICPRLQLCDVYQDALAEYRQHILNETRYVNLKGIPIPPRRSGARDELNIPLDKVYIRVQAIEQKQQRAQERAEQDALERRIDNESSQMYDRHLAVHLLGEYFYHRDEVYKAENRPDPVDPEQVLDEHKRFVILGAPGAGKSTLLRFVARRAAENLTGPIPVLVSLREFATAYEHDRNIRLSEFAISEAAKSGSRWLRDALDEAVTENRVLWLIDALDEAHDNASVASPQAGLLRGQMVLTSRPVGYQSAGLQTLPHYEIVPLVSSTVEQFLSDWLTVMAERDEIEESEVAPLVEGRVKWLQAQIKARPQLAPLISNPLMLTFLAILTWNGQASDGLPNNRAELYGRYIDELITSWESMHGDSSSNRQMPMLNCLVGGSADQTARQAIYYLGWLLHLAYYGGKGDLKPTRQSLREHLAQYFVLSWQNRASEVADASIDYWQNAGMLDTWLLEGQEYLAFRHLTFQEYAAAWAMTEAWKHDQQAAWSFLQPRLHHYAWREPTLLLAGLFDHGQMNRFIQYLLKGTSPYERDFQRDFNLAIDLVYEGANVDDGLRRHVLERLVGLCRLKRLKLSLVFLALILIGCFGIWLLVHAWPISVMICLIWILAWVIACSPIELPYIHDSIGLVISLTSCITDTDYWINRLPNSKNPLLILELSTQIKKAPPEVRRLAVYALGEVGDASAVPALLEALKDSNEEVRRGAADALGEIGDASAAPALLEALKDSYDEEMLKHAAGALGKIGDASAVPGLLQALKYRDKWGPRYAADALGEIGDASAVPALLEALKYRDKWGPRYAADALGKIGDASAVPALLEALKDSYDEEMYKHAAGALGKIGDASAVPGLLQALKYRDKWGPRYAADALGEIGDASAVPALLEALKDNSDAWVRRYAAEALGKIGDASAVPGLLQALKDNSDAWVCKLAAEALRKIDDASAVPALLPALKDSNVSVRRLAVYALGEVGDASAVPALLEALKDSNEEVRRGAADALAKIGDASAVPALLEALKESYDEEMLKHAAGALGKIGDASAVPGLLQALKYRGKWGPRYAADALGEIGDASAVPALLEALKDSYDEEMRKHAADALGEIGDASAVPGLLQALKDNSEQVRKIALDTLVKIDHDRIFDRLLRASGNSRYYWHEIVVSLTEVLYTQPQIPEHIEWHTFRLRRIVMQAIPFYYLTNKYEVINVIWPVLRRSMNRLSVLNADALQLSDPLLNTRQRHQI